MGTRLKYTLGALSKINEIRSYPDARSMGGSAEPRSISLRKQRIFILNSTEITQAKFSQVLAYYISRFYPLSGHHKIERARLAASIAGIILNCADWGALKPWTRGINAFAEAGVELGIQEITIAEFEETMKTDERYQSFVENWTTDVGYILSKTDMMLILSSCIVLAMIKNLTPNNFSSWFKRRILTFSGTVGDMYTPANIEDNQLPEMPQLQALFSFISANHILKKTFYLEIVSMALSRSQGAISRVFSEVHHLMRGHELQHLIMIDKYIFEEHPEFLDTFLLRGLRSRFASAIRLLKDQAPTDRLYIKILYDKDYCVE